MAAMQHACYGSKAWLQALCWLLPFLQHGAAIATAPAEVNELVEERIQHVKVPAQIHLRAHAHAQNAPDR